MSPAFSISRPYSRAERISDSVVHVVGVSAALVAVPALIALTATWNASGTTVAAASVYGTTLLAMLTFSALYNMLDQSAWSGVLRRLDHAGIYFKIAGTYTPFTLTTGAPAVGLLATLWSAAVVGAALKLVNPSRFRWPALALYLLMGWAGVFAGGAFLSSLGPAVLALILAGGVLYTAGVVFFLWTKLPFHNTIWHVFVLTASGLFFAAVTVHLT
jgi:hemolysin III